MKRLETDLSTEDVGQQQVTNGFRALRAKGVRVTVVHSMALQPLWRPASVLHHKPNEEFVLSRRFHLPNFFTPSSDVCLWSRAT
jgi:hypothetical protein